jgi:hypothetical protein
MSHERTPVVFDKVTIWLNSNGDIAKHRMLRFLAGATRQAGNAGLTQKTRDHPHGVVRGSNYH